MRFKHKIEAKFTLGIVLFVLAVIITSWAGFQKVEAINVWDVLTFIMFIFSGFLIGYGIEKISIPVEGWQLRPEIRSLNKRIYKEVQSGGEIEKMLQELKNEEVLKSLYQKATVKPYYDYRKNRWLLRGSSEPFIAFVSPFYYIGYLVLLYREIMNCELAFTYARRSVSSKLNKNFIGHVLQLLELYRIRYSIGWILRFAAVPLAIFVALLTMKIVGLAAITRYFIWSGCMLVGTVWSAIKS